MSGGWDVKWWHVFLMPFWAIARIVYKLWDSIAGRLIVFGLIFALSFAGGYLVATAQTIPIEDERRCSEYDKARDYKHKRSVEYAIAEELGGAYSPYDKVWHDTIKHTDIEHIVATAEAHDSGLCARSVEVRTRFANDLDNLTLSTPGVNRRKGGKDPAEWMPEYNKCWFIGRWYQVKDKYGLSMDYAEAEVVSHYILNCEDFELEY